jgi:hypothetical protein
MLVAPTLDNYSVNLFSMRHSIELYPATIYSPVLPDGQLNVENEGQLGSALKTILRSENTKRTLGAILAQINA